MTTLFEQATVGKKGDLFSPVRVGPYTLKNRMAMAPMTRNRAGAGNVPTALMATYYGQRASAGLLITEATQVSPQGVGYPATPGIHSAEQVEGWRQVVRAVHEQGGRIFLQLWHTGRISHPSMQPGGALPVAPSAIQPAGQATTYSGMQDFVTPRALETHEIPGIVEDFRRGAALAKEAGFDGVELHGANGYLVDQFLRDGTNRRTDRYGGSVENRARFLLEVTEALADVWGADRVAVRLSPSGTFNDMRDSTPRETFGYAVRKLSEFGLAYLHLTEAQEGDLRHGSPNIPVAEFRPLYRGVLMTNGGYDRARAEKAIGEGAADLVSFGVPFLANPDLVERFRRNAPLNAPDFASFYGGTERGYTDYPTL